MIRVVLDTNVIVSAMLTPQGVSARVVRLAVDGHFRLCVDQRILAEYYEVLQRPRFTIPIDSINNILAFINDEAEMIVPAPLPLTLDDPDDRVFVEVAAAAKADFLVTGNVRHFSGLKKYGLRVVSPAGFLEEMV